MGHTKSAAAKPEQAVEQAPRKYTDDAMKQAFLEITKKLGQDILSFEDDDKLSFEEIWNKTTLGNLLQTCFEDRGLEFETYAQTCASEFKAAYIPNPAGLRTETLELYSKLVEAHNPNGWVPIQMMGPGLIMAHFIPAYPKPDIPPYIVNYALISEKAYWDYQAQVQGMEINDIRTQNQYKLVTRAEHSALYKDSVNYREFLQFLLLIVHESSHEYQLVKALLSAIALADNTEPSEGFEGVSSLKGKINNAYDTWVALLDTTTVDEFREMLNVGDDYLPVISLEEVLLDDECKEFLQAHRPDLAKLMAMPVYVFPNLVGIASSKADDPDVKSYLADLFAPKMVQVYLTSERAYNNTEGNLRQNIESAEAVELFTQGMEIETLEEQIEDLDSGQYKDDDDRVINFVNQVLKNAIEAKASDIHFEVSGGNFRLRYRIDGKMMPMFKPFPSELAPYAIRRIKVLCKMDTSKNRQPCDGGLKIRLGGVKKRTIDMRVATCPVVSSGAEGTTFEKCTIRILDDEAGPSRLDEILWVASQRETLKRVIANPYGIMIVTGPTGSGKSTTLYSVLNELNTGDVNIVTAEDPVERKIAGVNQTPVMKPNTFAHTLKSFLRMDPDIILVGEVRDDETAELAVKASQTGHLVLTTLHANTAMGAVARLEGLKVKRADIAGSLLMVSAQRLGRKLCKSCRRKRPATRYEMAAFHENHIETELVKSGYIYEGRGCPICNFRGYKGRIAIMEMLEVTNDIKDAIENEKMSINDLKRYVIDKHGFSNMYINGLNAVARGEMDYRNLLEEVPDDNAGLNINVTVEPEPPAPEITA